MFREIVVKRSGAAKRIGKREQNAIVVDGLTAAANYWQQEIRPVKFTPTGARRYQFARRFTKNIFSGTSKRKGVSGDPLVWSGRTRVRSRQHSIRRRRKSVTLHAPVNALNFRNKWNPINLLEEYRRTLPSDVQRMEPLIKRSVTESYRQLDDAAPVVVKFS